MRRIIALAFSAVLAVSAVAAQPLKTTPVEWKWLSDSDLYLADADSQYRVDAAFNILPCGKLPEKFVSFPIEPEGAVNLTYSPDSTMLAFTRDNDLYVVDIASGKEKRLTFDGSDVILNGYASWVYYEEIFGRPSRYRAFWWSPDSRKIAYYRFDDSRVPMFPIYSPKGQDGSLRRTHYPKAGERNPEVRIGFIDVPKAMNRRTPKTVWADFNPSEDQYFGTPFWSADSKRFFVAREPRIQNTLDLYSVDPSKGTKTHIYNETYPTWLDWIDGMLFGDDGLYMVRSFETLWQQIYFLSYDGKTLKRLTDGENWRINLLALGPDGTVYFTSETDSRVRQALYSVDLDGNVKALTDPHLHVSRALFSPDCSRFVAAVSSLSHPTEVWVHESSGERKVLFPSLEKESEGPQPELITMTTEDGFVLPATIAFPKDFDSSKKYPVHVDIYGGPDTPLVTDRWQPRYGCDRWFWENGIIQVVADCRAAGHNGRKGLDMIYKHLSTIEVSDFVEWAQYLKSLPYVNGDKIGVEGFSFGGTMTTLLVATAPDDYHYGIAGGGVYDWKLYDTHYTERFMSTPEDNPDGYESSSVLGRVGTYPVEVGKADGKVMLKITHGTGDDNVHFQNTLQLIDVLHKDGKEFEFMIYPDGMHGYRGYQGKHFLEANRDFWSRYLLDK